MNDEIIVEQIKNNNMEVWEYLINSYKQKIFSMTYKFTDDYNEAQDLAQEIFLKIYRKIELFDGKSSLSTWIYRLAVNMCMDYKRKKKFLFFSIDENTKSNFNAEEKVIDKEHNTQLHKSVTRLPDKYKTVIILYHFNDLSYKEIAELLNIPVKTVETRLYRARKKLKKFLTSYNYGGELSEM